MRFLNRKLLFAILVITTFLVLPDAVCVSDEGIIFQAAKTWVEAGYSFQAFLANPSVDHSYTAHHLLWFLMQAALFSVISIFKPILPVLRNDLVLGAVMTYLQVAAAFVAVGVTYCFIRKNKSSVFSILATAFIWLGSYGIGFLAGGCVEPTLCIATLAFVWILSDAAEWTFRKIIVLAFISFLMVAIKQYCLIFCCAYFTAFFFLRRDAFQKIRFYIGYLAILALLFIPWFWVRHVYFFSPDYYTSSTMFPLGDMHLLAYTKRIFDMLFGFSYGLFWTAPFFVLALAFQLRLKNMRDWIPKIFAVVCMLLFFGVFRIGVGDAFIAGNRYFFPFLLIFIPETVNALTILFSKKSKLLILFPVSFIFFFPTLQYRHDNILWEHRRTVTSIIKGDQFFSDLNPSFHPAVFAWKIQMAKLLHKKDVSFKVPGQQDIVLETNRIAPMSVGPHLVHVLRDATEVSEVYKSILESLPRVLLPVLQYTLYVILLGWIIVLSRNFLTVYRAHSTNR